MLLSLQIKNFLLIDQAEIDLSKGLCVLTGETGAGKSIILNSINFILGAKNNSKIIRSGESAASVTVVFDIANNSNLKEYLNEIDIDITEDDNLIIRRTIDSNNRSKIYLGDSIISLNILKNLALFLVEIHGQHEQSSLTDIKTHRNILDEYGDYKDLLLQVSEAYNNWKIVEAQLKKIQDEQAALQNEAEYLEHLIKEISELNPAIGEEKQLSIKRIELQNKDKIIQSFDSALSEITEINHIEKGLLNASKILSRITSENNEKTNLVCGALDRASIEIGEAVNLLEAKLSELKNSDDNIDDVEKRLFLIKSISRKYNTPADELKTYVEDSVIKLEKITQQDKNIKTLELTQKTNKENYIKLASLLSEKRKIYAKNLENEIQQELNYLKMDKARFRVSFKDLPESNWGKDGIDQIKFESITNPGQEFSGLSDTASGGELSRFMLAIKVVLSKQKTNIMLIFDETDSGIGGVVADLVGNRLSLLAKENQILLITHQAQIAARASIHLFVKKEQSNTNTKSFIKILSKEERYDEVARMLAGDNLTTQVMEVAKQLVNI